MRAERIIACGLVVCLALMLLLSCGDSEPLTVEQQAATATAVWTKINSDLK